MCLYRQYNIVGYHLINLAVGRFKTEIKLNCAREMVYEMNPYCRW